MITHGQTCGGKRTQTYEAWRHMRKRCENPRHPYYADYGGRGIEVCERWRHFAGFFADMGECPKGLTLDRIDNSLGYSPENCRWTTRKVQQNNRRTNRLLTHRGRTLTVTQWADHLGVGKTTLFQRLRYGWSVEKALTRAVR